MGRKRKSNSPALDKILKRQENRRLGELKRQEINAATRAKYGRLRRAAPVIIRSLETGEVIREVDSRRFKCREYSPLLNEKAREAGFEDYAAYLASPHWASLRVRVLERDRYCCHLCRSSQGPLQVHHDHYNALGSHSINGLKALCPRCHKRIHHR